MTAAPLPGRPPVPRPGDPRSDAVPDRDAAPDPAAAVERAMAGLEGLDERPLAEHVAVFERVHAALGDALAAGSTG